MFVPNQLRMGGWARGASLGPRWFVAGRFGAVVLVWSLLAVLVSAFRLCFTLCLFIILLVQFGLLGGRLLGNSCPLDWRFVPVVFCLFVVFVCFPFWF